MPRVFRLGQLPPGSYGHVASCRSDVVQLCCLHRGINTHGAFIIYSGNFRVHVDYE